VVDRLPHKTIAAPRTGARPALGPLPAEHGRKLVISNRANPVAVEQYRRLAATVHELQVEQGLRTLMVTSAVPGEGKTLTAVNLALTLSEACERRVVLIDADLRRPCIHQILQLPNARGLSDALCDNGESPLMQVSEFLSVLPAGPTTEPLSLTSERMRRLVDEYAASFDWVLLDAAPVGFMSDARLLARLTRAVLFVIASHITPHSLVSRAIAEIGEECIIGTVLNRVEAQDIPAAGYYQDY
jgi:capsular exopolysaccharide synthesis family protein